MKLIIGIFFQPQNRTNNIDHMMHPITENPTIQIQ